MILCAGRLFGLSRWRLSAGTQSWYPPPARVSHCFRSLCAVSLLPVPRRVELISYKSETSNPVGTGTAFGDPWPHKLANQPLAGTHCVQVHLVWRLPARWLGHWNHHNVVPPAKQNKTCVKTNWLKHTTHWHQACLVYSQNTYENILWLWGLLGRIQNVCGTQAGPTKVKHQ